MNNSNEPIMVSISCPAYNHVKYIARCLDGFISQKTDFRFEVIVHDDASTDGTADIIREYEHRYPDIIKPIYQTENQYSKGVKFTKSYILPKMQGKYVAFCEGDDYWCDEQKLQKQVEALETHSECSICTHYVQMYEVDRKKLGGFCPSKSFGLETGIVDNKTQSEIMLTSFMQLSSYMVRKNLLDIYFNNSFEYIKYFPTGDIAMLSFFSKNGSLYFINNVMSVYNHGTEGSWTKRIASQKENLIAHCRGTIDAFSKLKVSPFLDDYEKELVETRIKNEEWRILTLEGKYKEKLSDRYEPIYNRLSMRSKAKILLGAYFPSVMRLVDRKRQGDL